MAGKGPLPSGLESIAEIFSCLKLYISLAFKNDTSDLLAACTNVWLANTNNVAPSAMFRNFDKNI